MRVSDNAQALEDLREIVGEDKYDAIVCRFAGEKVYIPKDAHLGPRNNEIRQEYDKLLNSRVQSSRAILMLCRRFKLSERTVRRIVR